MKGKKLLAGLVSAAMVIGTMAFPAFADDAKMTFEDFIRNVEAGNGTFDGNGVTVKWSPVSGCYQTEREHECTANNKKNAPETPTRIDSTTLAQYHIGDQYLAEDLGDKAINISNVNFVYEPADFTICMNSGWAASGAKDTVNSAQLYFLNSGNVSFDKCTFEKITLTARNDQDVAEKKVSITNCAFKDVSSYGIKDINANEFVITGNTFDNCEGGVMLSGTPNLTVKTAQISNNTFKNVTSDSKGLVQIAANCKFDNNSELTVTDNTSDTLKAPVFRWLSESLKADNVIYKDNSVPAGTPLTTTTSVVSLTEGGNGNLSVQEWADNSKTVRVGAAYYATLHEALKAVASENHTDTVTVECKANADVGTMTHAPVNCNLIIKGNNATVTGGEHDFEIDTFTAMPGDITVKTDGLNGIAAWGQRTTDNTMNLEFTNCYNMHRVYFSTAKGINNITIKDCSFSSIWGGSSSNTSVYSNSKGNIVIDNCDFNAVAIPVNLNNKSDGAQNVTVTNSRFNNCSTTELAQATGSTGYAAPIRLLTTGTGATTSAEVTECGFAGSSSAEHGDILLGDGRQGKESTSNVTLKVRVADNADAVTVKTEYPDGTAPSEKVVSAGETAVLTMLASGVSTSFENAQTADGEVTYDFCINADDNTINRLTSAEFKFEITTSDAITYEITGTDNVNVKEENGEYLFNFDGTTAADASGNKIKLGQVKFTGFGTFSFNVAGSDNAVHATTASDNIVTTYIANPTADTEGKLTTDNGLRNVVIAKPVKTLEIKIDFNNKINKNAAPYQAMKVVISGGDLAADKVIELGEDNFDETKSSYNLNIENELTANTAYTVTVSGAGYRTTRYTVTMTDNKVLNFWNNVKDNAVNVEDGKDTSAKNVTFLAGDIVKDNTINIYDLSAVVSYFGTLTVTSAASDYAKYDLNRDGKIDSKDVAYVLVSWGK